MQEEQEKEKKNPYHLDLKPGEEERRSQWNLILVSDIPVGIDFGHTDMLERVIVITGVKEKAQKSEEVER